MQALHYLIGTTIPILCLAYGNWLNHKAIKNLQKVYETTKTPNKQTPTQAKDEINKAIKESIQRLEKLNQHSDNPTEIVHQAINEYYKHLTPKQRTNHTAG